METINKNDTLSHAEFEALVIEKFSIIDKHCLNGTVFCSDGWKANNKLKNIENIRTLWLQ